MGVLPYTLPFRLGEDNFVAPSISNITPAGSTTLAAAATPVSFDLTDDSGFVVYAVVRVQFDDGPDQVAFFGEPGGTYQFASSWTGSVTPITDGFTIELIPGGLGWGENPTVSVYALDGYGNAILLEDTGWSYAFTPADPDLAPTIESITPAPDTTITSDTPIEFDTVDDHGFRRIFLCAKFTLAGSWEVIHDGASFGPKYSGLSTRTPIAGGYHYVVQRLNGWPESPTFEILPIDTGGQEPDA